MFLLKFQFVFLVESMVFQNLVMYGASQQTLPLSRIFALFHLFQNLNAATTALMTTADAPLHKSPTDYTRTLLLSKLLSPGIAAAHQSFLFLFVYLKIVALDKILINFD